MDLDRILKPEELIDRLKYAEKQCVRGYYYILIRPDVRERIVELLKEQKAVEPFHKCTDKNFSLIEDSNYDYCPYCGKPITWAKQEGR